MDGDVNDNIPRAAPEIPVAVNSNGRPRCMCRRAITRALKCGAPARWTILRLETASALVVRDKNECVKHGRRPTCRTEDAIVQGKECLPDRIHACPRDRDYSLCSPQSYAQSQRSFGQQPSCLTRTQLSNSRCSQYPMTTLGPEQAAPWPPGARTSRGSSNPGVSTYSSLYWCGHVYVLASPVP